MRNDREWASELADKYESGEYGWTKGRMRDTVNGKDCFCLTGGIAMQLGGKASETCKCCVTLDSANDGEYEDRLDLIGDFLGGSIATFNDHPTMSLSAVIGLLREFAGE